MLARQAVNITLEPGVYDEFCTYVAKKGIRVSPWVSEDERVYRGREGSRSRKRGEEEKVRAPQGAFTFCQN